MLGWRAKVGLIVPASNTTNEPEWERFLPEGVTLHTARMTLGSVTESALADMSERAEDAAARLKQADVDVIVYGCTTGSLVKGHEYAHHLEESLEAAGGAPAVTTALSVERALDALDISRMSIATPYNDSLNEREVEFLEASGRTVDTIDGRGFEDNLDIGALTSEDAYRQGVSAFSSDSDGLFISCTNYRTFDAIRPLESDLGVPVVTSNQATLWDTFEALDIDPEIHTLGQLFTTE